KRRSEEGKLIQEARKNGARSRESFIVTAVLLSGDERQSLKELHKHTGAEKAYLISHWRQDTGPMPEIKITAADVNGYLSQLRRPSLKDRADRHLYLGTDYIIRTGERANEITVITANPHLQKVLERFAAKQRALFPVRSHETAKLPPFS